MTTVSAFSYTQSFDGTQWLSSTVEVDINPNQIVSATKIKSKVGDEDHYLVNLNSMFNNQIEVSQSDYQKLSGN